MVRADTVVKSAGSKQTISISRPKLYADAGKKTVAIDSLNQAFTAQSEE